jgi:hypothetical protein
MNPGGIPMCQIWAALVGMVGGVTAQVREINGT